jgi:hypothetical protein
MMGLPPGFLVRVGSARPEAGLIAAGLQVLCQNGASLKLLIILSFGAARRNG